MPVDGNGNRNGHTTQHIAEARMPRSPKARPRAPLQLNHADVRQRLLAYSYGRLSREEDAAVTAHVARCEECRADGLHQIATERARIARGRPRARRRPMARALAVVASILLGVIIGLALYLGAGKARAWMHPAPVVAVPITPTVATPLPTPGPRVLRARLALPAHNVTTLAWSPDGTILATASAPQGNDAGGVVLFAPSAQGSFAKRLPGFEGLPPPGALVWSPDGLLLAAAGAAHVIIWNVATAQVAAQILLPSDPGTDLFVFATATGNVITRVPATIFLPTGILRWGANGQIQAASPKINATATPPPAGTPTTAPASAATGTPPPSTGTLALWDGRQGVRLFRAAGGGVMIGSDDDDVQRHAAFLRWSPDGRYLLWGYPRLPITASLASGSTTASGASLAAPDAAVAAVARAVAGASRPAASVILWPAPGATTLAVLDATRARPQFAVYDAASGRLIATVAASMPSSVSPAVFAWQGALPLTAAISLQGDPTLCAAP
jgi:hypothetical protein